MNFGKALKALKSGDRVARVGWNGKGIFIFLVPGSTFKVNRPPLLGIHDEGTEIEYHAHIDIDTTGLVSTNPAAPRCVVPWFASQTDLLSEDWEVLS